MTNMLEQELNSLIEAMHSQVYESIWHKFNFLRNPFPRHREIIPDICVDQDRVKNAFRAKLVACYRDNVGDSLHIIGDTGAGKTNILKYYEELVNKARMEGVMQGVFPVYVSPGDSYLDFHRQLIESLGNWFFSDLFERVSQNLSDFRQTVQDLSLDSSLINAIEWTVGPRTLFGGVPVGRAESFQRWLSGGKQVGAAERRDMRVSFDIDSSSIAVKVVSDFLRLLNRFELCRQLVILFDEFEEIVSERFSRPAKARYTQDIRHFLDSLENEALFVVASTPLEQELNNILPALSRRLGESHELQPIHDETMAIEYAQVYINHARAHFDANPPRSQRRGRSRNLPNNPLYPLTDDTVVTIYRRIAEERPRVLAGFLLPALHSMMNNAVGAGSEG